MSQASISRLPHDRTHHDSSLVYRLAGTKAWQDVENCDSCIFDVSI